MNHAPGAGSIAQPVDLQPNMLRLPPCCLFHQITINPYSIHSLKPSLHPCHHQPKIPAVRCATVVPFYNKPLQYPFPETFTSSLSPPAKNTCSPVCYGCPLLQQTPTVSIPWNLHFIPVTTSQKYPSTSISRSSGNKERDDRDTSTQAECSMSCPRW